MEKFKENKITEVLNIIAVILAIPTCISLSFGYFYESLLLSVCGLFLLITIYILFVIASANSDIDEYTREVIKYISSLLKEATTIEELNTIQEELLYLSTKDGRYITPSYIDDIKKLYNDINSRITVLTIIKLRETKNLLNGK